MRQQRKEEIMAILYANTRDASEKVTASQAILNGLAKHGGLYVPTEIPKLDIPVEELAKMSYQETAYAVMSRFLTDFTEEELKNCIDRAYDSKFDTPEIAPLVEQMVLIIWSCSMAQPLHSKIWHYPFFRIC